MTPVHTAAPSADVTVPRNPLVAWIGYPIGVTVATVVDPLLHRTGSLFGFATLIATSVFVESVRRRSPTSPFHRPHVSARDSTTLFGLCAVIMGVCGIATIPWRPPIVRHGVGLYGFLILAGIETFFGVLLIIPRGRAAAARRPPAAE